jgi:hypothetical protein
MEEIPNDQNLDPVKSNIPTLFFQILIRPTLDKFYSLKEIVNGKAMPILILIGIYSGLGQSIPIYLYIAPKKPHMIYTLCGFPIWGIIVIAMIGIYTLLLTIPAKLMKGVGVYRNLFYLLGAILAPYYLILGILTGIGHYFPMVRILNYIFSIYVIYPTSIAIEAEHQLSKTRSIILSSLLFLGLLTYDMLLS